MIVHAKALAVALTFIDAMLYGASVVTAKVAGRDPQSMLGNHEGTIQVAATSIWVVAVCLHLWRKKR